MDYHNICRGTGVWNFIWEVVQSWTDVRQQMACVVVTRSENKVLINFDTFDHFQMCQILLNL